MKIRLGFFLLLTACGTHGKLRVDTPIAPYQPPDISEITGIDEDSEAPAPAEGSAAAHPGK